LVYPICGAKGSDVAHAVQETGTKWSVSVPVANSGQGAKRNEQLVVKPPAAAVKGKNEVSCAFKRTWKRT